MERLTGRNQYGMAYYECCFDNYVCNGEGASEKCKNCDFETMIYEKLASYEDTGSTPEQIIEMDKLYSEMAAELGKYKKLVGE